MDILAVSQLVAIVLGVLAIVWHQQRSIDKLRSDFERAHDNLRSEFGRALEKLRDSLDGVKERLSRIEGSLGIGMPSAAAAKPSGADLAHTQPEAQGSDVVEEPTMPAEAIRD